jgi:type VI secretion system secreted protein Hcp
MSFDTFLQFTGGNDIKGESTAKGFEGQIEIYSFSLGASNPVTIGSGSTGISGGKVSLSGFNCMKKTELSSCGLFSACCSGQHFPSALVTLRKATGVTGGQAAFLTYTFEDVMVESIQWSGSTGGDDTPTESLSIAYGKVSIVYSMQDDDTGAMSPKGNASWDQTTVSTGS